MISRLFAFIILLLGFAYANQTYWHTIKPGLQYTQVYQTPTLPSGAINAFKINLNYYHLQLIFTKNYLKSLTLIKDLVITKHAILGINGGFFGPNLLPLGLRIKNGKQISPIKKTSWWGIFYIKNNKAYIVAQKKFKQDKFIDFAIQSGPRLVINGKIPSLKPGWSFRSALGITNKGNIIIAISNHLPLTTKTFAAVLASPPSKGGLGCIDALNLDGGSSSQLYASIGSFTLDIPSFAPVSDAILVFNK